jgi:cardiolipin synthase
MRLNFEMTALVIDQPFSAQVAAMLEQDFAAARPITAAEVHARDWPYRFAVRAARLLDPIL